MNLQSITSQFENDPNVQLQQRCGFCNGLEEAEGNLGVEIAPEEFMEIPIGPNCLSKAQESQARWVDNPADSVVE